MKFFGPKRRQTERLLEKIALFLKILGEELLFFVKSRNFAGSKSYAQQSILFERAHRCSGLKKDENQIWNFT